jgi:hypothetical protein
VVDLGAAVGAAAEMSVDAGARVELKLAVDV